MKINIITYQLKNNNRYVNISLLFLGFFMFLFLISLWFPTSELMKDIYLILLVASVSFILLLIFLLVYRQSIKRTIYLSQNEIVRLTVNSQIDTDKIKEKAEIEYAGNEIETVSDAKLYEIDNTTAFALLKNEGEIKISNSAKKSSGLEIPPKELFNQIISLLWAVS